MRALLVALLLVVTALGVQAILVATSSPMEPLRLDPVAPDASRAPVDDALWIADLFAPWILHETDAALGRQDIPTAMDFDGDDLAKDNWEDLPRYELLPTVYYTIIETDTHYFATYHLYHPRDWARLSLGVQDTHEGDGENIQVVAEKSTMTPVLLTTQAHYDMWSYASLAGPIHHGRETLRSDFEITTGHPVVYVESGGHGIYGSHDPRAANRLAHQAAPVVTYRPAHANETIREPGAPWNESAPYRLVSLPAYLRNSTDHPTLFARAGSYDGHMTPRYHLGDRYSGPLGNSRGISPFALGYGWSRDEVGSLFWDPGARYQRALAIEGNWSTEIVSHPFLTS